MSNHVPFCYGYKLVCVDDQFSKPFMMLFMGLLIVCSKKVNNYIYVMKKNFSKEVVMIEKDCENFQSCTKC